MKKILLGFWVYTLIIACFLGVYWLGVNSYMLQEKGINSFSILGVFLLICTLIFLSFVIKTEDEM